MRTIPDEQRASDGDRRRQEPPLLGAALLVSACVVAVWWGALGAGFVFDDIVRIVHAEERLAWPWTAAELLAATQRPLVDLSLAINHAIGGLSPRGYHAFNIAVHALNAAMLALVVGGSLRLLRARGLVGVGPASDVPIACAAALVWALHPLQTSAATYVIQRAESMAALGTLAALWFLLRASSGGGRSAAVAVVLATAGALLSKPTAVSVPFVLLAVDACVIAGGVRAALRARPWIHGLSGAALLLLVVLGVTDGLFGNDGRIAGYGAAVAGVGPIEYAARSVRALGLYMAMMGDPSLMAIDRGPEALDLPWCLPLGLATLAAIAAAAWIGRERWWRVLPWCFVLLLAPTTSIVPIADAAVDHRMYLPSAVIVLALAGTVRNLAGIAIAHRVHVPVVQAVVALSLLLVVVAEVRATVARNRLFADPIALWSDAVRQSPGHARAYINRAGLLLEAGRVGEAERDLDAAARLQPGHPMLMANRAIAALARGDAARAEELLAVVTASMRADAGILGARGDALRALGRADRALGFYALAAARAPGDARFVILEANTLADLGRHDDSIAALARARARTSDPGLLASIEFNTGNAHYRSGRLAEAAASYRAALAHDPTHAEAWRWLREAEQHASE
jgi:Flp pilus assembly protein TadD